MNLILTHLEEFENGVSIAKYNQVFIRGNNGFVFLFSAFRNSENSESKGYRRGNLISFIIYLIF